ncbi:MAG: ATP-binding protein [Dehalococcoidia bacterium]
MKTKTTTGVRNIHFWIILALTAIFSYIYYGVLTDLYDIYVILFFYPLLYAAIVFRLRGVIVSGLVFLCILLPHVFIYNTGPYSLYRIFIFAAFAFLLSGLVATLLNYMEHQFANYIEILSLNRELKESIRRLESTQKQLIQSEKLNAMGQIAASIAHEVNNPLAGVLVYNKLLSKKLTNDSLNKEEALDTLNKIESAVSHCSQVVQDLLDFTRQSEPVFAPLKIAEVIDQAISLIGHQAKMNNVEIIRQDDADLSPVDGDIKQLKQVFLNLIINAIQAMPDGGTVTITTGPDKSNRVSVSIKDTGHGIEPGNMEKLFTPFFTTKESGKGVGLGLAVSQGIIERHGGSIEATSSIGDGSTFTVFLPFSTKGCE